MTSPSPPDSVPGAETFPLADVRPARRGAERFFTWFWLLTLVCLLTSIGLVLWHQKPAGRRIVIQFEEGHGLQTGNRLQYRGIEAGEVVSVTLAPDGRGVEVAVLLQPQASSLACEGSQFWIVRPRVSLSSVSGLETVVGARYLVVRPGPEGSPPQSRFQGLENPLLLDGNESIHLRLKFKNGYGLSIGDPVRHRGITIGEVTAVDLSEDFRGVVVAVRLTDSSIRIARQGSLFWIERPSVSVMEVRGLETLIGGRYIAVLPGPPEAAPVMEFEGLETPPPGDLPEGGLEVILEAGERGGLTRGVPVLYRGLRIGHVIAVDLANDAASVEARAWIDAPYRSLVCENSKFWMNSGVDVEVGLSGLKLSADSLTSIMTGGVSLATPPMSGRAVTTGHRFACVPKPDPEWKSWQPRIETGDAPSASGLTAPQPVRVALRWQERVLGFRRDRQRTGWVLPLADGRLLGLADLLQPVEQALDQNTQLEIAGQSVPVSSSTVSAAGQLAVLTPDKPFSGLAGGWPLKRIKPAAGPSDCVLLTAGQETRISVAASRFTPRDGYWEIDPSLPLTGDHHGACVVTRADGMLAGIVALTGGQSRVIPVPNLNGPPLNSIGERKSPTSGSQRGTP